MKKILIICSTIVVLACSVFTIKAIANDSQESAGYIEYSVTNMLDGVMSFDNFSAIYNLLPRNIQELFIASYMDINNREDTSFYYNDVLVKHPDETTWEFYYKNCSVKVHKVNTKELSDLFLTASY